jgi:SAM-dependent methyltransferase
VSEWLVERVDPGPGQTLLELGAGTGETGFLAAARLGDAGHLISSDFSPQMVRAAQQVARELGVGNAEFQVLDAERIELDDASVDGVVCRWSYMLFGDPLQALREARRVLRPRGRLALSTWGKAARNPWMTFSARVMIEHGLMAPFSSEGPGVFAMSEAEAILPLLAEAGFGEVGVEELALSWRLEDADELWIFVSELQGPVAVAIGKLEDEERVRRRSLSRPLLSPSGSGRIVCPRAGQPDCGMQQWSSISSRSIGQPATPGTRSSVVCPGADCVFQASAALMPTTQYADLQRLLARYSSERPRRLLPVCCPTAPLPRLSRQQNLSICRPFERRERRDSNPRPPA